MSTFMLVSFADESSARNAFDAMHEMHQTALMRLSGAALIDIRKDGSIALETTPDDPVTPVTLPEAAVFGLLLGSAVSTPQFGFAVGGAIGAVFEKHQQRDDTVDQKFRDQVSKALRPGHWAVLAYATEVASGEVRRQLDPFGGDLFSIELSTEDESVLTKEVGIGE